ncbi:MAG: helix-turn-helix domain-containing protein, partial [Pseudomonadota bacterium]
MPLVKMGKNCIFNSIKETGVLRIEDYHQCVNGDCPKIYQCLVDKLSKPLIELTLKRTFGNQFRAAKLLGINRNTLHSKIKKLKI